MLPDGLPQITFSAGGGTDSIKRTWSGDMLMDVGKNEALKMTVKAINGVDYLFIEAGNFGTQHPPGWKTPILVFAKQ